MVMTYEEYNERKSEILKGRRLGGSQRYENPVRIAISQIQALGNQLATLARLPGREMRRAGVFPPDSVNNVFIELENLGEKMAICARNLANLEVDAKTQAEIEKELSKLDNLYLGFMAGEQEAINQAGIDGNVGRVKDEYDFARRHLNEEKADLKMFLERKYQEKHIPTIKPYEEQLKKLSSYIAALAAGFGG